MRKATLGPVGEVSRLTLGGGGIDVLDCAPTYRNCQAFIGELFGGRLPKGVKITTKHQLGNPAPSGAAWELTESLRQSLRQLRVGSAVRQVGIDARMHGASGSV